MLWVPKTLQEKAWMLQSFADAGVNLPFSDDLAFICNRSGDKVTAAVAFNSFCGRTCQMHQVLSKNSVTRRFLWAAFDYPFNQADCVEVVGIVKSSNEAALKLDFHLGFREIYRVPAGWSKDEDMVILTMRKEECKWLELGRRYENEYRKAA